MTESSNKTVTRAVLNQTAVRRLLCALMALTVFMPATMLSASAQTAPAAPSTPTAPTSTGTRNLDLTSTDKTVVATQAGTIGVNGTRVQVNVGDHLTPAETVALYQLIRTGTQSIVLGALGNATGGTFNVTAAAGNAQVSQISIPSGVTGLGNVATNPILNITGNLTNAGSLYFYSTAPNQTAATVNAQNISNNIGGLISTALPTNFSQLYGVTGALAGLSLNLNAVNNIVNAGRIISSGNLALTAGNSIINALPTGVTGATPVMQAANNLNLVSNSITNAGLMAAIQGNLNITGLTNGALSVDSRGGTMQALMGAINVRDSLFGNKANFTAIGGEWLSKELNVFSGTGIANLNVEKITGLLNIKAGEAHTLVNAGTLNLGTIDLSGDPTFFNSSGNVTLNGNLNFSGAALAVVARGDILTSAPITIDTSSAAADGGAISFIAGANFTTLPVISGQTGPDTTTTLTITGGSPTGGKIDLSTNAITSFNSSSSVGNGGNINLVAFAGSSANSGTITLPTTVDMNASGASGFNNGNINVIAGRTASGTAIQLGGITSTGGSGGNVTLSAATPTITGGNVTVLNGVLSGGTFTPGTLQLGDILVGSTAGAGHNTNIGGAFSASTNGGIATSNVTAGGNITMSAGSSGVSTLGLTSGNNISLSAKGGIHTAGVLNAVNNITLTTTANNGNIVFDRNVVAGGTVTMAANGSGRVLGLNQAITTFGANGTLGPNGFQFLLGGAPSPDGTKLYVPDYQLGIIAVIDTATNTHVATFTLGSTSKPQGIVVSADGSKLYVTEYGSSQIQVLDTSNGNVLNTIPITGGKPELVALHPSGNFLYVLSDNGTFTVGGSSTFKVIDLNTNTVTQTINLTNNMAQSGGIVVNPQGTLAYVTNSGSFGTSDQSSKKVFVIDITGGSTGNSIKSTIDLSAISGSKSPYSLALDPTGLRLYVGTALSQVVNPTTQLIDGNIIVIDASPTSVNFNKVIATATLPQTATHTGGGTFPQGISMSPTGTELYIQSTYLSGVSSLYTSNNTVLEFIQTGAGPDGFGSGKFSFITTNGGVPNVSTYTENTLNLSSAIPGVPPFAPNTITLIQKPTIQAHNINLSSGSGDIIANYSITGGGTFTANTGGSGGVVAGNLSAGTSNIGASSAGSVFQVGSLNGVNVTGNIVAPTVSLSTTQANANIVIGATVGKVGGNVTLSTITGNITSANPNSVIPQGTQFIFGGAASDLARTLLFKPNTASTVSVIDTTTNATIDTIDLNAADLNFTYNLTAGKVVASTTGGLLYITVTGTKTPVPSGTAVAVNGIAVIDRNNSNAKTIYNIASTSGVPQNATLSPDGATLYVLNSKGSTSVAGALTLSVVNASTGATTNTINLGTGFAGTGSVAVNDTGTLAYVSNSGSKTVSVVNLTTKTVQSTIDVSSVAGQSPIYLSFDSATKQVFIASSPNPTTGTSVLGSVAIIDANSASSNFNKLTATGANIIGSTGTLQTTGGTIGFSGALPILPSDPTGPTANSTIPLLTSFSTLGVSTGTAAGSAYINNNATVTLNNAITTNTLSLTNNGAITTPSTSTISGQNISFSTSRGSNGGIMLGSQVGSNTTNSVFMNADGSGNIMVNSGSYTLQGTTVTLNSGFGSIGSAGIPIRTVASNLSSTSLGFGVGSTFLTNTGNVNLDASGSGVTFQLVNAGSINIVGLVTNAGTQTFIANGGNINVGANVGVTDLGTSTTLIASGAITNPGGVNGGIVRGFNVTLTANGGDIGAPTNNFADMLMTSALNLKVTTPGSAYISAGDFAPYNINIQASSASGSGGKFQLFADGQITVTGAITADNVDLETYQGAINGNIIVGANLGKTGIGTTTLVVDGGSSISQTAGTILSSNLIIGSQYGDVGSAASPIRATTNTVFGGTGGLGNFYLSNNSANLNVVASGASAGKVLQIVNTGNITVDPSSPISAAQMTLQTLVNGNISIASPLSATTLNSATVGGSLSANSIGNVVSITVKNAAIATGQKTISYTVAAGNSFSSIASGLAQAINTDGELAGLGITATAFGGGISLASTAAAVTTYTTAVTQGTGTGFPTETLTYSTTPASITLNAGGTGNISTSGAGALDGITISLLSGTGNIGSLATPISVGASSITNLNGTTPTVTARTSGSGNVFLNATTAETISGSAAGFTNTATFNVTSAITNALSFSGFNSAGSAINVNVGGPINILSGANLFAPTVSLVAGTGNLTVTGTVGTAGVSVVNLTATTGNIVGTGTTQGLTANLTATGGTIGTNNTTSGRLATMVSNLTANGSGSVFVRNIGLLTLGASSSGSTFDLTNTSNIAGSGPITAPTVVLASTGGSIGSLATPIALTNATNVTVSAAVSAFVNDTASAGITLGNSSAGSAFNFSGNQSITTGSVTAPTSIALTTTANNGDILMNGNVGTASTTVSLNANGSGNITQGGGSVLRSANLSAISGSGIVTLTNTGATNLTGAGGSTVSLTSTAGLTIAGNLGSPSTVMNLTVSGINNIMQFNPAFTVTASSLNMQAGSGSIGMLGIPIKTAVGTLTANVASGTTGSVVISNTGNVNLSGTSRAGSTFNLTNTGTINLNAAATVLGGTSVTLTANGANADITQTDATGTTTIFAPTVSLTATRAIGTAGNLITVASAPTGSGTQTVNLTVNAGTNALVTGVNSAVANLVNLNMTGTSNAASSAQISASNDINLAAGAQVRSAGSVTLTTSGAGKITEVVGTTLVAPTVVLNSATSIGTSLAPVGINSGVNNTPANVSATATGGVFLAGNTIGLAPGSLNLDNISGTTVAITSQGSINVNAGRTVQGSTSLSLSAIGVGSITQTDTSSTPTLFSPVFTFSALGGNIGTAGNNLAVALAVGNVTPQSVNLTANSGGNVFINGANGAGLVSINTVGASAANGGLAANTGFSLTATGNVNFNNGSTIFSPKTITIGAGAGGSITQTTAGNTPLMSTSIQLSADTAGNSGNIGASIGAPIGVMSGATVSAAAGNNVFIRGAGVLALGTSIAGGTIDATSAAPLTVSGSLLANSVNIHPTSSIILGNGNITAASIALNTGGLGTVSRTGTSVLSASTALTVDSLQFGSSLSSINVTNTPNVTFSNTHSSSIYLSSANGPMTVQNTGGFSGPAYQVSTTNGNLTIQNNIASFMVTLSATGTSSLILNGNVGQAGATVALRGDTGITQALGQVVTAGQLNLQTNTGDVGTNLTALQTNANNISSVSNGGNFYINNASSVNYNTPTATPSSFGTYNLSANGNITISNPLNAANVNLSGIGSNSAITINSTVGTGAGAVITTATGSGNITAAGLGLIKGASVALSAQSGSIGFVGVPVQTQTQAISATVNSGTGSAVISNSSPLSAVTVTGGTADGVFSITDTSPSLTVNALNVGTTTTRTTNTLTVVENQGNIVIGGNVSVKGGSAVIQDKFTGGTITFNPGVSFNTLVTKPSPNGANLGSITIVVGPTVPTTGTNLSSPSGGLTFNTTGTGKILLGTGSNTTPVSLASGTATVNAINTNVIFSTPTTAAAGVIQISNGVTITADPPAPTSGLAAQPVIRLMSAPAQESKAGSPGSLLSVQTPTSKSGETTTTSLPTIQNYGYTTAAPRDTAPVSFASGSGQSGTSLQSALHQVERAATGFDSAKILFFDGKAVKQPTLDSQADTSNHLQPVGNAKAAMLFGNVSSRGLIPTAQASEAHKFSLNNGGVLFAPDHDMLVETPMGSVHVSAQSMVLVVVTKDGIALYNLHDDHRGDVFFTKTGCKNKIELNLGQHMMVAATTESTYEDINPLSFITHRDMHKDSLPGGLKLYTSQFSITSAVGGVLPLAVMQHSTDAHERKLVNRLIKDAAIIMQTKSGAGIYKRLSSANSSLFTAQN